MEWEWEGSWAGGVGVVAQLIWGQGRSPSWLYSCKLHCSNCHSSSQNKKQCLGRRSPSRISGSDQQEHLLGWGRWLGGLLASSDGQCINRVRAECAGVIQG